MKRLEVLGWWFNERAPTGLPRPQLLVSPWLPAPRAALATYLRAGKALVSYPEASFCRFACGEAEMGRAELTDGTFVWPEGLVHYVERHEVRLPERFLAHVQAQAAQMPRFVLQKPQPGLFDTGPWLAWGQEQRACLDLDGWDIPVLDVLERIAGDLARVPYEAILLCRGATREVVLAVGDGALEVHQLKPGGHAPQRLAGWHEWPLDSRAPRRSSVAAANPQQP